MNTNTKDYVEYMKRLRISANPDRFNDIPVETQKHICEWIRINFIHSDKVCRKFGSYTLKHRMQSGKRGINIYCTNGHFKGAMRECGFRPANPDDIYWFFRISYESPALDDYYLDRRYPEKD